MNSKGVSKSKYISPGAFAPLQKFRKASPKEVTETIKQFKEYEKKQEILSSCSDNSVPPTLEQQKRQRISSCSDNSVPPTPEQIKKLKSHSSFGITKKTNESRFYHSRQQIPIGNVKEEDEYETPTLKSTTFLSSTHSERIQTVEEFGITQEMVLKAKQLFLDMAKQTEEFLVLFNPTTSQKSPTSVESDAHSSKQESDSKSQETVILPSAIDGSSTLTEEKFNAINKNTVVTIANIFKNTLPSTSRDDIVYSCAQLQKEVRDVLEKRRDQLLFSLSTETKNQDILIALITGIYLKIVDQRYDQS